MLCPNYALCCLPQKVKKTSKSSPCYYQSDWLRCLAVQFLRISCDLRSEQRNCIPVATLYRMIDYLAENTTISRQEVEKIWDEETKKHQEGEVKGV